MLRRFKVLIGAAALMSALTIEAQAIEREVETQNIEQWRTQRVARLTSETGWLTLAGLFWLQEGENTFGRDKHNRIALDHAALANKAGAFTLTGNQVRFTATAGSGITQNGQAVTAIDLKSDAQGEATVLSSGALQFFIIDRAGRLGVRVRDTQSPLRKSFSGIQYFDIDPSWHIDARFEPYSPSRKIKIASIIGTEDEMECPGAVVFNKDGKEWRLDAVLEEPEDKELFVMFSDATSGRETYGAGRFMYIAMPVDNKVTVDFNKAYNPPCAFNQFATCPLPPQQNRLKLRVEAGEKTYGAPH